MEDIAYLVERIKRSMKRQLPSLQQEIDTIIREKVTDTQTIERMLDILLDYGQLGVGETQFRRLNTYYAKIHPKYARIYTKFYDE